SFTGNERKVSMTGEAYFEVAKSYLPSPRGGPDGDREGVRQKFIVAANGTTTEVLGTHFNVNAYDDENDIKVTLLEGSVKVSLPSPGGEGPGVRLTLKPGQQAVYKANSHQLTANSSADLEQVMAWKSGLFKFDHTSLTAI